MESPYGLSHNKYSFTGLSLLRPEYVEIFFIAPVNVHFCNTFYNFRLKPEILDSIDILILVGYRMVLIGK